MYRRADPYLSIGSVAIDDETGAPIVDHSWRYHSYEDLLGVLCPLAERDPKTVRRWINGRVPYPDNRTALADLVGAEEADLWPEAAGPLNARSRPEELTAVYPHRWSIPREAWRRFFESADHEIDILAYSALWLAEDAGLLAIIAGRASRSVRVRIILGDPAATPSPKRSEEEGIGDAMSAKARNAIALFAPLTSSANVDLRLHGTVL